MKNIVHSRNFKIPGFIGYSAEAMITYFLKIIDITSAYRIGMTCKVGEKIRHSFQFILYR